MANTPSSIVCDPEESEVLDTANTKTSFRINNLTSGKLYVRLGAANLGPNPGQSDFWIPPGVQYFSDYEEYSGEIRVWSQNGGTVGYSKEVG